MNSKEINPKLLAASRILVAAAIRYIQKERKNERITNNQA